ncbi:MAG: ABC transporter permease [Defluviitaleaceae bacterium]|nr:ABC transporter permease [Defluviitaleaceae bacterium]
MRNVTLAVMKKEIVRIFNDRKLLFAAVILPGILIFAVMSATGMMNEMLLGVDEDHIYEVHAVNMPESIGTMLAQDGMRINIVPANMADTERIREDIADQNTDLLVVFPADFDAVVADFDPLTATVLAPNVEVWSNSARNSSAEARNLVMGVITMYHHSLTHRFSINLPSDAAPDGNFDLASAADIMAMLLGMLLPMMFILFIFTGCQSLVPESVAGEKERGTLGTLLVTTASRQQMALGKILGLSFFALLGALGSFVGLMFSMENMVPGMDDVMGSASIMDIFSVADLVIIFLIAISLSLFFVALLSVLSTYSKSVKEANAITTPLTLFIMVGAMGGGLVSGFDSAIFHMIPIFNSSLAITALINSEATMINNLITIGSNLLFAGILTAIVAAMFSSEKIVFD